MLKRIKSSAYFLMGRDKLDQGFYMFMWMVLCYTAFIQMNNVFLNTFLLKSTGDTNHVMWYNLVLYITQPPAMILSVYVMRRTSPAVGQKIGFALYALAYVILVMLGECAAAYIYAFAVLLSAGAGFYWNGYILEYVSFTTDENRDTAAGVLGFVTGGAALVVPLLSGALISALGGFLGYQALFVFALLTTILAVYFSGRMPALRAFHASQTKPRFRQTVRALTMTRPGRDAMMISLVSSIRDGTMAFFLSVLLYTFVKSELLVGVNSFLGGLAGILSAAVYARLVRPERRVLSVYVSVTALVSITCLLVFRLDPMTIIAFNVANNLLMPFFNNPPFTAYLALISVVPELDGCGAEVHTVREFAVASGRALGIVMTLLFPKNNFGYVMVLLILVALQYVNGYLTGRVKRELETGMQTAEQKSVSDPA